MEIQQKAAPVALPQDDLQAEWDPDEVLQRAQQMSRLKDHLYMKAHGNIKEAQEKDKHYYDLKHSNSQMVCVLLHVLVCVSNSHSTCTARPWYLGAAKEQQKG